MYYGHLGTNQKCPDYQGVLIFQVSLYDKAPFVQIMQVSTFSSVLINRFHCIPYTRYFSRILYFAERKSIRILQFNFQVEYIVSLSHCFFSRIKILHSTSLQRNPRNLRPSKITAYTVYIKAVRFAVYYFSRAMK